jgi:gluconolactonase
MRVVATDLWFPEGPVWVGDGSWLVVEIRRKTLTRIWPDGRKTIVADIGGGPNSVAIGPDGHCYVCNNGGFSFKQRADGLWVSNGTPDDYVTGRYH